jgi:hypothetical protein
VFYDYCHLYCYLLIFLVITEQISFPHILMLKVKLLPQEQKGLSYYLMYGLLHQAFTLHELANLRGTEVGKPRPVLEQESWIC